MGALCCSGFLMTFFFSFSTDGITISFSAPHFFLGTTKVFHRSLWLCSVISSRQKTLNADTHESPSSSCAATLATLWGKNLMLPVAGSSLFYDSIYLFSPVVLCFKSGSVVFPRCFCEIKLLVNVWSALFCYQRVTSFSKTDSIANYIRKCCNFSLLPPPLAVF